MVLPDASSAKCTLRLVVVGVEVGGRYGAEAAN